MDTVMISHCFFFQAEDGIRDLVRSRGLGDVYKRQLPTSPWRHDGGGTRDIPQVDDRESVVVQRKILFLSLIHI